ncbi:hypothetical protein AB5I41_11320 [Sphingomonas sp. MMS24-JH45]
MEAAWDAIGYIQFGDNPGRKEPGDGRDQLPDVVGWLRARAAMPG